MDPFVSQLLDRIARRRGYQLLLDPVSGSSGSVSAAGKQFFFKNALIDINPAGAAAIASDKDRTQFFLNRAGFTTIPSRKVYRPGVDTQRFQDGIPLEVLIEQTPNSSYPLFVKPNAGFEGRHADRVTNADELRVSAEHIFLLDTMMLVQPFIDGDDYRFVVLDDTVPIVYRKTPPTIIGDGVHTVEELFVDAMEPLRRAAPQKVLDLGEYRIARNLGAYRADTILPEGVTVRLLDNTNLSTGGKGTDVTEQVEERYKEVACRAAQALNLRFVGVDMFIHDDGYTIIELNAKPSMRFFAQLGDRAYQRVEWVYEQVCDKLLS